MFSNSGVKLIDSAVSGFTKIAEKLNSGIALCNEQRSKNLEQIKTIEQVNQTLGISCERAKKVLANLQPFLV